VIKIARLEKEYPGGIKALREIELFVPEGEFVALLGPSGAGKSTLLRCINGLVPATAGRVVVNGISVNGKSADLSRVRRVTGMIFQQFNLVMRLTVLENVLCGRLAHSNVFASCLKLFSREDIDYAMTCLVRVGLAYRAHQRADRLSGGQQQRVGIARALVQRPRLILADEPVASLDPRSAVRVMEILKEINRQDRITVLVSLHNVELAMKYADRAVGIKNGAVVVDKPVIRLTEQDVEEIYGCSIDEIGQEEPVVGNARYALA